MKIAKFILAGLVFLFCSQPLYAQPAGRGGKKGDAQIPVDSWEVNVKQMPPEIRAEITETMGRLKGSAEDRGIIAEVGQAVGLGLVSGLVDAVVSETFSLAQYRKKQKQEWMRMIQNENNYSDSITSIKGLKDFYAANSHKGALDPSDINFDGIEIRGMRAGQEVIYLACSIDRDNLEHMFRHSKFNLVIDTLAFYPYQCHLPNMTANGIRIMNEMKKGKSHMRGDSIIRPGSGGNAFSFDERDNLRIAIDFSIYSSWINEAVQVHKDVELGKFKFSIRIPDNEAIYTYSRNEVINEAKKIPAGSERDEFLNENLLAVEGDSFVVPRSYMPLDSGDPMWGTGEYNIKVKVSESCQLVADSEKAKHWREDYKRLRQMQNRSGEVQEYFKTLWNQYGNNLVKSSYSTALRTTANNLTGQSSGSAGARSAATKTQGSSGMPSSGAPSSGATSKASQGASK